MKSNLLGKLSLVVIMLCSITTYCQVDRNTKVFDVLEATSKSTSNESSTLPKKSFLEKARENGVEVKKVYEDVLKISAMQNLSSINGKGYMDGGPANMFDLSTLKPVPGAFSTDISPVADNLNLGKVNINIPLFDFEYYDFKMPVFINNNYPQKILQPFGEPTFYTNTRVGGPWTLSIDQFKVSRQINGIEDENPAKGYFSSASQLKVNNPSLLSDGDILIGLKGEWDPAIDVYNFSTPTVSGSFLLNLSDGSFKNLSDGSFTVKYTRDATSLLSFTITDDQGIQYLFGGDNTSVEISQSKTNIKNFGVLPLCKVKYIIATDGSKILWHKDLASRSNFFLTSAPPIGCGPCYPPLDALGLLNAIQGAGNITGYTNRLYDLGDNCYGIPSDIPMDAPELSQEESNTVDDADMRRNPVNTAWYLKEIKLINGKKINFSYSNTWDAYRTLSANRTEGHRETGFKFQAAGDDSDIRILNLVEYYECMPLTWSSVQWPINESTAQTTHFVKSPKLLEIHDEDFITSIEINPSPVNSPVQRPYVCAPSIYPEAPQEAVNEADTNPTLISKIRYKKNNQYFNVDLINSSTITTIIEEGIIKRTPWNDRSTLDKVIINNDKKYLVANNKITYPTGATKQFYASSIDGTGQGGTFRSMWPYPAYSGYPESKIDSIVTVSERNRTVEKYILENGELLSGPNSVYKTYRPGTEACTSKATFISSSPIFNSYATKGGYVFRNAKKYINNELRISSDIPLGDQGNSIRNYFYLSGGVIPNFDLNVSRPATHYEEKFTDIKKVTEYKKTVAGVVTKEKTSDYSNVFTNGVLEFPSIYLSNIEAGPWSSVAGATKRGYSTYYYPTGVEVNESTKKDSLFLDNNTVLTESTISTFSRFRHTLGTNIRKLITTFNTDSEGNVWLTANTYNLHYPNNNSALFQSMRRNNISPILATFKGKNRSSAQPVTYETVESVAYNFKLLPINSGIPALRSVANFETTEVVPVNIIPTTQDAVDPDKLVYDSRFKEKIVYDQYDSNGKLIEYHTSDGIYTSIIWGYKGQYPIAKIENARYSDIASYVSNLQTLSNQDVDNCTLSSCKEQILRVALDDFRNAVLSEKWMVSTYTYDSDKGITSSTDARGITEYYEYDNLLRLKSIKDYQGNILKDYQYHYKN